MLFEVAKHKSMSCSEICYVHFVEVALIPGGFE